MIKINKCIEIELGVFKIYVHENIIYYSVYV